MAIAHDATTTSSVTSASSDSFSHTIGSGSDRILVVGVAAEDTTSANTDVSNITYNGVALTQRLNIKVGTTTLQNTESWDMLDASLPSTGAYTVAVTCGGTCASIISGTESIDGASQAAPEATNTSSDSASSTSHSTSVTTLTNNAWGVDVFGGGTGSALTADGGQTKRWDTQAGTATGGMSTEPQPTAGSLTMGWTYASINRVSQCVSAYAPAAAASTNNHGLLLMGVG